MTARRLGCVRALALVAGVLSCGLPAFAAARSSHAAAGKSAAKAKAAAPAAPADSAPAPYEPDLLRLSEIMGSLSYLRNLCGDGDGAAWRAKMTALLQVVGDSQMRRERMAGAYNKGFRDYELIYRTCTPNARTVIANYLDEGAKLTREVATRYGSG